MLDHNFVTSWGVTGVTGALAEGSAPLPPAPALPAARRLSPGVQAGIVIAVVVPVLAAGVGFAMWWGRRNAYAAESSGRHALEAPLTV